MKSRFLASLLFAALAVPALAAPTVQGFDNETVGAEPKSFAAAVARLAPRVRLAKVDTEANQALAAQGGAPIDWSLPPRAQVEAEATVAQRAGRRARIRVAAQPQPNPGQQLLEAERFRHLVVGTAPRGRRRCR